MRFLRPITWLVMIAMLHVALTAGAYSPADDLPGPPAHLETVPAGSLVIPMDNNLQNLVPPFNIKAYGLINRLLQNGVPLKWAIKAGKAKDGIDFSATVQRIAPTAGAAGSVNFSGGPFIVHRDFAQLALAHITAFGGNVVVYQLTADASVDVRYDLTHRPQIAVNTVNSSIHTNLYDAAGIPDYTVIDVSVPGSIGANSCYTHISEPHTTITGGIADVKAFVLSGGNFLSECRSIETYENDPAGGFQTTAGITIANTNNVLDYPNADLAYSQFVGDLDPVPGGSEQDWELSAGSVFQNNGHVHANNIGAATPTYAATAAKLFNGQGGNVFYLGGHNYGAGGSDITSINGQRMILNAIFVPATRPAACGLDFLPNLRKISGQVFEDANGDGNLGDGVARPNVNVRIYADLNNNGVVDAGDTYLGQSTTDATGTYTLRVSTLASGNFYLAVVDSKSVTPSAGFNGGFSQGDVWAEQTYGDDPASPALDLGPRFGGAAPALSDSFNPANTAPASNSYKHVARINVTAGDVAAVDFGFSFNVVTNVRGSGATDDDPANNRTVQGSLRQFIQNANAIASANAMRFVPAVAANAGTWWRISITAALPAITDSNTTLDGRAYSSTDGTTVLDTNAGTVGTGGTVGVDAGALAAVNKPELEIQNLRSTAVVNLGFDVQASSTAIRRLAIYGFGAAANSDASANIKVSAGGSGALIEQNVVGSGAGSFADPGAATRSVGDNIRVVGGANATIQNNVIGFSAGNGVALNTNATGAQILSNEIRGNGLTNSASGGVNVGAGSTSTIQTNLIAANNGAGVDVANGAGANTIVNNTVTGDGTGAGSVTSGIRLLGSSNTVDRNIITTNTGAGVMVGATGLTNTITKNSIFANTGIGIDLLSAADNQTTGTAPYVTLNDTGDTDVGGNGLLNFPVITTASISGGNLVINGFARPGSAIEMYIAAADATGFGEGKTYLVTLTEGSASDTDSGTGAYTNPVNGLNQGADTTNRFTFTIPVPSGVIAGTVLTSTATLAGATSEFSGNATVQVIRTISGTVFEDVNYGGGAGRTKAGSSGVGRQSARVELFDSAGNYVTATTTDANGDYSFAVAAGSYTVRVVNSSVTSSRAGYVAGLLPVQTFRTNASTGTAVAVTDYVGGETPNLVDAGDGSTTLAALTTATTTAQSIAPVTIAAVDVTDVDFGFNFDTVVKVNDSGQGSLRQFISNANALANAGLAQSGLVAGKDNAVFMISNGTAAAGLRVANNYFAGGVATISPASALPAISDPAILDASIQPGFVSTPIIQLNGAGAGAGVSGLTISAGSSVVRGLIVNSFLGSGIALSGAGGNTIQGNYLGTNSAGTSASQNDQQGIYINGSSSNTIGGATAVTRNVISGNRLRGILVEGAGATGNTIAGNYIGLNATGTAAVPNILGIFVSDAPGNTLGGTGAGAANVISGNTQIGLQISGNGSTGNVVQGNTVGLNSAGGAPLPNGTRGIDIVAGAAGNTIGGTSAGAGNIIADNGSDGLRVTTGTGNRIQRNSIYGNTGLGINLGLDNVTANNGAVGGGPNNGMDYPVFNVAALSGGTLAVAGYVGSAPGQAAFANAVIEIFKADNSPADQNGEIILGDGQSVAHGEGRTYLGTITAGPSGNFNTTLVVAGLSVGDIITATATNAGNDTSEFSANIIVTAGGGSISGFGYTDANLNSQRDSSEAGTGLTLYVKLVNTTSPGGPALAVAVVDPATGAYTLPNVATGTYTLILDDNNTLTDVTPTIAAGWTGTEMPSGVRSPVAVNTTGVPNQNFGLYHGLLISGRVFDDNGAGGGVANDGTLNGGEPGIAAVVVQLTDASGATTYSTATTNASGNYALALPSSIAAGTQLKIVETNAAGYLSTGANVGNTGGSYARPTDTITFTVVANTSYTNVNFGDVPPNTLTTDGQQAGLPGTTLFYTHTFAATSAGTVLFSTASVDNPAFAGWTVTLYRDLNSNGQLDANEPVINGAISVNANDVIAVIIKVFIPTNAPFGAKDQTTLTGLFTYTGAAPALSASLMRQDVTTVGNPTTAGLTLSKSVDKPSAAPGETISYTIAYSNNSTDVLRNVIIYDNTPAFTKFVSGSNGPLPLDLTGVALTAPSPGQRGAMKWTFTGTLRPGGSGTVTYQVALDQ